MAIWLLVYHDQHVDHHALFSSYKAAGEQVIESVKQYLDKYPNEFLRDDLKKLKEMMSRKAYGEIIDFWHEHTVESFDLEEHDVQGGIEELERNNVHAILIAAAKQVLIEEVVGINLSWKVGEPIQSDITYQTRFPLKYVRLQLSLPSLDGEGDKKDDDES